MKKNLLELQVKELYKEYGAGNPTPGAGTAAAGSGLKSAQLILTVIKKTIDKESYNHVHEELDSYRVIIENRILPRLEILFQLDSDQFQEHMKFRLAAQSIANLEKKNEFLEKARTELMPCVEIPLEIASLSKELSKIAIFLVDYGFSAVRGDANIALNCASAAIGGCISIIDLNLLYFDSNDWTSNIENKSSELTIYFESLCEKIKDRQRSQKDERYWKLEGLFNFQRKYNQKIANLNLNFDEIEQVVSELQNTLWKYKKAIWKSDTPMRPFQVLDPEKILNLLGYKLETKTSLGHYYIDGKEVETAGVTDKSHKIVALSEQFQPQTKYFTLCHELGHVILHENQRIYRDGPINGSFSKNGHSLEERQANLFATCFSMPKKIVISEFERIFKTNKLEINEDTMFKLNQTSISVFRKKHKTLRDFSLFIAGTESYNHSNFQSMSKLFGVSKLAMAIRLEQLGLLEY